ncbi:MAG: aminotransferase class I/II-fold pyridoxal phosphate-dependent enzyme [Anaerococcus sp.]|nr:aminotransferase class I/II-fold pyridoxal phosphate-dependent enzyme [Anaerococcus sp.]
MLKNKLDKYLDQNYYPFHMPGSKRSKLLDQRLAYRRDLTEIIGFDNLNDPKDIFVKMQDKLAKIYQVKKTLLTTNGSTSGILSAIRAMTYENKNIIIQRSCHKAVYNACELNSLKVDYIGVDLDQVNAIKAINLKSLENKFIKTSYAALVVTSPSYEGYNLDIEKIYELCKKYQVKLIVDMAHGSHLPLAGSYKPTFDLAITSFHKNLSALTPAAGILINDLGLYEEVKRNMAIFQSSSPSYLILQSIDEMIEKFDTFPKLYKKLEESLDRVYEEKFANLDLIDDKNKDRSKIMISVEKSDISGFDLQQMLYDRKIEIEMAYPDYALLISTIFDSKHGFERLIRALKEIDKSIAKNDRDNKSFKFANYLPNKNLELYETINRSKKFIDIRNSEGEISADFIYAYPPGIPILVPGELIDKEIINIITFLNDSKVNLNIDGNLIRIVD